MGPEFSAVTELAGVKVLEQLSERVAMDNNQPIEAVGLNTI